jgi:3',5'-cyclic-AMP phosphodiesterase
MNLGGGVSSRYDLNGQSAAYRSVAAPPPPLQHAGRATSGASGPAWLGWCVGVLGSGLFGSGCLRPSEERVQQDLAVGRAEAPGISVQVDAGQAAVRELLRTRLTLWASAPRFSLGLSWQGAPPEQFLVEVRNCMPGAELSVDTGVAAVLSTERSAEGVCSFQLSTVSAAPALHFAIQPPDSERARPFRFAVMSDVQEAIPEVQDIFQLLNRQAGVEFLLGAGDLTEQGTLQQLQRFQRELEQLDIPYYTTLGNHELGPRPTLYHEYFGRGSQSFVYRGVRFTLLDSASAMIDPTVLDWLDDWLAQGAAQPHVVAMHIPPLDPVGVRNGGFASRNEAALLLGRLAAADVDMTFYGHIHSYYHFENAGIPAHISGGGGAIPERFDDIGRHFLVVDADPSQQTFAVSIVRVD